MECAKELLCTTNYKIKDVASEADSMIPLFSKTFKKFYGLKSCGIQKRIRIIIERGA